MEISLDTIQLVIGGYFVLSGLIQVFKGKAYERYALDQGVVNTSQTVKFAALALIALGVVSMLPGISKYGFYGLSIFMVLSGLSIHKFWESKDISCRVSEGLHFGKNLVMAVMLYGITLI